MTMSALLLGVLAPGVAAALAPLTPARASERLVTTATGLAALCALALAAVVALGGRVPELALGGPDDALAIGLRANELTVILLLLVTGVSWIVQRFAQRSLAGDARAGRFFVLAGALTTAAAVTPAATTLLTLVVGWSATSVALIALIALYRGYDEADEGARRTATALLIGDAALWTAAAILIGNAGAVRLDDLASVAQALDPAQATLAAALVLVAAMARSVQVPFHGWLPATLASPTPVSALLHAGVVNAGGILLLLLSPLLGRAPVVTAACLIVGTATAAVGTALMLARPDVKGALAQSTVAQMGFMIAVCGTGLWPAAVVHLVAHGAYKASRFLGSGSAVQQVASSRHGHRAAHPSAPAALTAAVLAALPMVLTVAALEVDGHELPVLVFAGGALWLAGAAWIAAAPGWRGLLGVGAFCALAGPAYIVLIDAVTAFLRPAIPAAPGSWPSPWLLLASGATIALGPLVWSRGPRSLRDRLYVWALTVGDGSRPPRSRRGNPAPTLVIDPEGSQA